MRRCSFSPLAFLSSLLLSYPIQISLYFLLLSTLGASIIQSFESHQSAHVVNSFFLAFSAITGAGLTPWDTGSLSGGTFAVVLILMVLGGPVLHSLFPVLARLFFAWRQKASRRRNVEYRGLQALLCIVVCYHVVFHMFGLLCLGAWASRNPHAQRELAARDQSAGFWAFFHTVSAFSNVGISSFSDSLHTFREEPFPLLVLVLLALMGNTMFPVCMRGIVVVLYRISPDRHKPVFKFLLDNPRRCFTHLFLSRQTRWLFIVLVALNLVQFAFFLGASWNSLAVAELSPGYKVLNGFFASVVTRTAGFESITLLELPYSVLVLYLGTMYLSATPVAVSMRASDLSLKNLPKESNAKSPQRRLADAFSRLFHLKPDKGKKKEKEKNLLDESSIRMAARQVDLTGASPISFKLPDDSITSQARDLLTQHSLILFIIVVIIAALEDKQYGTNPAFTPFRTIFEVISAYGSVGLSLKEREVPGDFSSLWTPWSKALLVVVMILGRMRNLPRSIDTVFESGKPPAESETPSPSTVHSDNEDHDLHRAHSVDSHWPHSFESHPSTSTHLSPFV